MLSEEMIELFRFHGYGVVYAPGVYWAIGREYFLEGKLVPEARFMFALSEFFFADLEIVEFNKFIVKLLADRTFKSFPFADQVRAYLLLSTGERSDEEIKRHPEITDYVSYRMRAKREEIACQQLKWAGFDVGQLHRLFRQGKETHDQ